MVLETLDVKAPWRRVEIHGEGGSRRRPLRPEAFVTPHRVLLLWSATLVCLGPARLGSVRAEDGAWRTSGDGRILHVSTPVLEATVRDGTVVSIEGRDGAPSLFVADPVSTAYPALRDVRGLTSAGTEARVECRETPGGARCAVRELAGDASAEIDLDLSVGEAGGLIVRQTARRRSPELLSASWGIAGIDASRAQVVVPAGGGTLIDGLRGPGSSSFSWPSGWQAALAIVQGDEGGFSVWADDPDSTFKSLEVRRFAGELTLTFGVESRAAFEEARSVASPAWHIRTHRGDWRGAALAFREAMAARIGLPPIASREPGWIRDVRLVVRVSNAVTVDHLRGLAEAVDPRQTLLYVPGWRKLPYDVLYPDYTPRDGFVQWCREAQDLGFRVMPHANLVGIGPKSPELPGLEPWLQTNRVTGERVGWYLDRPDHPGQIYCLDPASAEVRRFLIRRFREAWEAVRFDALHLDYPVIVSTHEGDVDGVTCARGAELYLRELQAALPDVALGTEGLNEVLLACSVAQLGEPMWVRELPGVSVHPVRSLLFAQHCGLYGHLALPSQATSFPRFLEHHDFFDRLGSWPTLSLDGPLDATLPGNGFVLRETRYFQEHRLRPAPDETRLPRELFAWRSTSGEISAVFDDPPGRRLAPRSAPLDAAWSLLSGVNVHEGPDFVADWRAFEGQRLFGLDPSRRYPLVSTPPDPRSLHLVSASRPIVLEEVRDSSRRTLFRLSGQAAVVADLVEEAAGAATGILLGERQEPIGKGATLEVVQGTSGGQTLPALYAHPPWKGDAVGGETYAEFFVALPAGGRSVLRFATGLIDLTDPTEIARDGEAPLSDGVAFRVLAEGQELFRTHQLRGGWVWHETDLSDLEGRSIRLRLVTGPGPDQDVSWDWALWGQPRIVRTEGGEDVSLRVFSPYGAGEAVFGDLAQPGRVVGTSAAPGGVLLHVELPRLQAFGFLHEAISVEPGAELSSVSFIAGTVSSGVLHEGSVWGSGTVGSVRVGEETWRTISGHPPDFGRTCLDWRLRLPDSPVRLELRAQVRERGGPVTFQAQVNGAAVWSFPMPFPDGWKKGSVDLSPWAGQPVLLSLVTDSAGTNDSDWALWADVRLVAAGDPNRGGVQRPCDCNQDGAQDVSDAVCLLGHLFLGSPESPGCHEATAAPGNLALLDFNGDRAIDLSDAVALLARLFLGGPPHVLGEACRPLEGCRDNSARCSA